MAMFLSRIKRALNLGTKSITQNGTYNASSDGYDGYSSVEVNVSGVTPTPITPSNASPATITSGETYTATRGGVAVEQVDSLVPSDSNPARIKGGYIYSPGSNFGYAITSQPASKTPSDSSPASVSSGAIIKASASGYLYSSSGLKNFKVGTFTMPSTGNTVSVTCGFQPKYIAYFRTGSSGTAIIYDENYSTTNTVRCTSSGISDGTIGNQNYGLNAITSTGFSVRGGSSTGTYYYFAVG